MQCLMERLSRWRKENPSGGYLLLLLVTWCAVQSLTRLVMLLSSAGVASLGPIDLVKVFGLGLVYDVGAGFFFLFLPALYLLVPQHFLSVRIHRWGLAALTLFLNVFQIFCAVRANSSPGIFRCALERFTATIAPISMVALPVGNTCTCHRSLKRS